ncbi:tetratricopeptide repeat protein [Streptomyces achromogenes]|uniref:tetratricopeptide repeat protein n=1 Tax=Streptomyces achromogenes TaxID=67255 RepID=UPI0033D82438
MTGTTDNHISGGTYFGPVVQGRTLHLTLPDRPDSALAGLPRRTSVFVGRDTELDRIHEALRPTVGDGTSGKVTVVTGLAGIGKTELVLQAAHRALDEPGWFPGGSLFVDLHGYDARRKVTSGQALGSLLRALGIPVQHIPPQLEERALLYRSTLAALAAAERRVLVVLDDVPADDGIRSLLPGDESTVTLISSRDSLADLDAATVTLRQLSVADGRKLLTDSLRTARLDDPRATAEADDADRLAELCGGLPLALRIVAALLVDVPARPLAQLRRDLDVTHSRLSALRRNERTVTAAFELSYRQLGKKQARLFRLMCLHPGSDFSTECMAQVYGDTVKETERLLLTLSRRHLVEPQEVYGRWQQHSLLRLYSGEQLLASGYKWGPDLMRLFVHLHETATDATDTLLSPASHRSAAETRFADRTAALRWLEVERHTLVGAVIRACQADDHLICLALGIPTVRFLVEAHYVEQAAWTLKAAIRSSRKLDDRFHEASLLSALGLVLRDMQKIRKSIRAHSKAIRICRQLKNHDAMASALNNLGLSLYEQRRFDDSIAAHTKAEGLFKRAGDLRAAAQARSNTGETLATMGRTEEASRALRKAAKIFRKHGDLRGYAQALGGLAKITRDEGMAEKAVELHERALGLADGLLIPHERATELANLATALTISGHFAAALTAQQEALDIFQRLEDHRGEAMTLGNMALVRQRQDKWRKAIALHTLAIEAFLESNDDHGLAHELTSMASALLQLGRNVEALENLELAGALYRHLGDTDGAHGARTQADWVRSRHAVAARPGAQS